jgi:hypothetical protein
MTWLQSIQVFLQGQQETRTCSMVSQAFLGICKSDTQRFFASFLAGVFGSSTPSFGPGFLGQGIGSGSFMNPSSMAGAMGMGAMGYYGPYSNTYGTAAAQSQGFAASPYAHGLHVPNPGYPYYGQSPYSQSPYF